MKVPETFPLIGLTMDIEENRTERRFRIKEKYVAAVLKAQGVPVLLPSVTDSQIIAQYLDTIAACVITGGDFDIPPAYYGNQNDGGTRNLAPERSAFERELLKGAWDRGMPILGVCGGMQLLNVFSGGTLKQHIDGHEKISHGIVIKEKTLLHELVKKKSCVLRSSHHQAVERLGNGMVVSAEADDGTIEGIELKDGAKEHFVLGVQWHPEADLDTSPEQLEIYRGLVKAAKKRMVS